MVRVLTTFFHHFLQCNSRNVIDPRINLKISGGLVTFEMGNRKRRKQWRKEVTSCFEWWNNPTNCWSSVTETIVSHCCKITVMRLSVLMVSTLNCCFLKYSRNLLTVSDEIHYSGHNLTMPLKFKAQIHLGGLRTWRRLRVFLLALFLEINKCKGSPTSLRNTLTFRGCPHCRFENRSEEN